MDNAATWTIMVPTLGERRALFQRLMGVLLPQLDPYEGRVRVLAYWSNGRPRLTEIRQRMVEAAQTEYVCWVDDDDLVPDYYVAEVMEALQTRPDYVGWQVQCYSNGAPTGISYHSLKYGRWWNEKGRYFRDISHLNPIRTDLARLGDFRKTPAGVPEDRTWAVQLRRSRRLKTEIVIDKIMYHYLFSTSGTVGQGSRWRRPSLIAQRGFARASIDHPHFYWHPDIRHA